MLTSAGYTAYPGHLQDSGNGGPWGWAARWASGESSEHGGSSKLLCAKSLQLYVTLCDPMDCSLPGSSVCGILQARILEWVAMPSSRGSPQPRDGTHVSCIGRRVLYHWRHLRSPAALVILL